MAPATCEPSLPRLTRANRISCASIWRELMERDGWGSVDEAWSQFRQQLELGRELEIVDENGDPLDLGGDYPLDESGDDAYD